LVAEFVIGTTARASSREPSKAGDGSPGGRIASVAADSAVPAAAMFPLRARGVPGEARPAMMRVVFFAAGIKPGPDIFETNPDFLFSLFIALLIINVLVVLTLLVSTRYIARLIYVPNRLLGAFILILAFVGVFSIRNSFTDCMFAAGFGYLGFILRRLDWPLVPIVLGLVLGSIMIEKLTAGAGQIRNAVDLINRPVSGTLFAVICLVILYLILSGIRNRGRTAFP